MSDSVTPVWPSRAFRFLTSLRPDLRCVSGSGWGSLKGCLLVGGAPSVGVFDFVFFVVRNNRVLVPRLPLDIISLCE